MGYRNATGATVTKLTPTLVTTAETIVFTTPPLNLITDQAQVMLFWYTLVVGGAGANGLQVRIRRGATLTDTIVNIFTASVFSAGTGYSTSGCYIDTPTGSAELQYSLTLLQSSATGNGTVTDGCLIAMVL